MTKHTPGPWRAEDYNHALYQEVKEPRILALYNPRWGHMGGHLATVTTAGGSLDREEVLANAYLIAAAPKLLSILEELAEIWGCDCKDNEQFGTDLCPGCRARAAIAEATHRARGQ